MWHNMLAGAAKGPSIWADHAFSIPGQKDNNVSASSKSRGGHSVEGEVVKVL